MKRRGGLIVIVLNLVALVALVFVYPHLMVSPGPLVKGHAELATDCFACHAPWRGAASSRCVECHALAEIGLRTTKGAPIAKATIQASFHQDLIDQSCTTCHSDHRGPRLTQRSRKPFSHELLRVAVRERCASCHAAPQDPVHRDISGSCGQCHRTDAWKPAQFDHALLAKAVLDRCEGCHKAPTDSLHRQVEGNCQSCHETDAWKPATFDHARFFVLDRDHDVNCDTCHVGGDFTRYNCYGCHEHGLEKVRTEHLEEGIHDFENCVECHRSAQEEPGRGASRGRRERD